MSWMCLVKKSKDMKTRPTTIVNLLTLVVGLVLVLLHNQVDLIKYMVILLGVVILVPTAWLIIRFIAERLHHTPTVPGWPLMIPMAAGLAFGILLVSMPDFFEKYMLYTFAVLMILWGVGELVFTIMASRSGASKWWILIPIAGIVTGIVVLGLGVDKVSDIITLLTGIVLMCYGINGLMGEIGQKPLPLSSQTDIDEPTV